MFFLSNGKCNNVLLVNILQNIIRVKSLLELTHIQYSNMENMLKIPWQYVGWIISQLQGFISVSGSDNTVESGDDSDRVQSCVTSAAIGYICHVYATYMS